MILVVDNYDSFVYNLARYVTLAGEKAHVIRNDAVSVADIKALTPEAIIFSPGPCAPKQAGICLEAVRAFAPATPILGVCLGHQVIGEAFGGRTVRATQPVHGKGSTITHNGSGLFAGLPRPMQGGRYHSLMTILNKKSPLKITARTAEGEIMAFEHPEYPAYGVQFHPESILTPEGDKIIGNFLYLAAAWHSRAACRDAA